MTRERRPEYTRPFSREYLAACGLPVTRMMAAVSVGVREYVDAGYVDWLESELTRARENAGGK